MLDTLSVSQREDTLFCIQEHQAMLAIDLFMSGNGHSLQLVTSRWQSGVNKSDKARSQILSWVLCYNDVANNIIS